MVRKDVCGVRCGLVSPWASEPSEKRQSGRSYSVLWGSHVTEHITCVPPQILGHPHLWTCAWWGAAVVSHGGEECHVWVNMVTNLGRARVAGIWRGGGPGVGTP